MITTCNRNLLRSIFVSAIFLFGKLFLFAPNVVADELILGGETAGLVGTPFSTAEGSYRHNYCSRYEELIGKNLTDIEVRKALSGEELSILLHPGLYFRHDSVNGIDPFYPGVHARVLDYMAEKGNFTWRNSFGVFSRQELGDHDWTELAQWGTHKFDIMATDLALSGDRINKGISFIEGHIDGSLIMVQNVEPVEQKVKMNYLNFLLPFEIEVWLVILGVVIFSSITYQFLEHIGADSEIRERSFRKRTMRNLYRSFINITGNYAYEPTTLGGKVFGFFFAFWAMLIVAAYTANLATILVVENLPAPTIVDVHDAISQRLRTCVYKGTYANQYLLDAYPGTEPYIVPIESGLLVEALNRGECDIMVETLQEFHTNEVQVEYNPTCTLKWVGRHVQHLQDGFATKLDPGVMCTDLVNEVFTYYINEMRESGYLEELWKEHTEFYASPGHCERHFPKRRRLGENPGRSLQEENSDTGNQGSNAGPDNNALNLRDMAGTMLFQVIGSVVAILVALVSGCDTKTQSKRDSRRSASSPKESAPVASVNDSLRYQLSQISQNMQDLSRQLEDLNEKVAEMQESMAGSEKGVSPSILVPEGSKSHEVTSHGLNISNMVPNASNNSPNSVVQIDPGNSNVVPNGITASENAEPYVVTPRGSNISNLVPNGSNHSPNNVVPNGPGKSIVVQNKGGPGL